MKDFINLRLKHSITITQLITEIEDLVKIHKLNYIKAIEIAVESIRVGDFETIGQAAKCRERLISKLTDELQTRIFIEGLRIYDINNPETRESLWKSIEFRNQLADYAGEVIAKSSNKFWNREPDSPNALLPINVADFLKDSHGHKDHFLLASAWLDIERYIYSPPPITLKNLDDGLINAYSEFTLDDTGDTNNPKADLSATYY